MILHAIYKTLITGFATKKFYLNQAFNAKDEYYVLKTIIASEDSVKDTFCSDNEGQIQIQIDGIAKDTLTSEENLEVIKNFVKGLSSVTDGVNTYIIENNITDGVKSISDISFNTWLSFFESTLKWRKLNGN